MPEDDGKAQYMLVHGEIVWEDSNNKDLTRPASVVVRLYQGTTAVQSVTVTPDVSGSWSYEFDKVPLYDDAKQRLGYSLKQEDADGYKWSARIIGQQTVGDTLDVSTAITDTYSGTSDETEPDSEKESEPSTNTPGGSSNNKNSSNNSNSYNGGTINIGTGGGGSGASSSSSAVSSNKDNSGGKSTISSEAGSVRTGDESMPALMFGMMLLSLAAVWYCIRKRRREQDGNDLAE